MNVKLSGHTQSILVEKLQQSQKYEEFKSKFDKCTSNTERVKCLYDLENIEGLFNVQENFKGKCKREAEVYRAEGNNFFKAKSYHKALQSYTKSILKAPNDSDNLSLAYNNRSLTSFYLKRYALCLQDVEFAFLHNYPKKTCYKLYQRIGRCMYYLRQKDEAIKAFQQTIATLGCAEINEESKEAMVEDMHRAIAQCSEMKDAQRKISTSVLNCCHQGIPSLSSQSNKEVPCLSDAVGVKMDTFGGRGLFAVRDIAIGEVLVVENPFSSVLLKSHNLTHCQNCCNRVALAVPCTTCSGVVFCSLACRNLAVETFHWAECRILESIQDSKGDLGLLSMRMALTAGYQRLIQLDDAKWLCEKSRTSGFNEQGVYDSSDYGSAYSLVNHSKNRSFQDLFRRTIQAFYYLKHLEFAGFLSRRSGTSVDQCTVSQNTNANASLQSTSECGGQDVLESTLFHEKCCIGGHVLRNLMMLPCNAHEVSELSLNHQFPAMSATAELAAAIYPILSLINHSCDPSVVRHSFGDVCVARAIRSIGAGEELKDNYGALYPTMDLATRQHDMSSQYFFTCSCEACANDWPQYFEIPCDSPVMRCRKCKLGRVAIPVGNTTESAACQACGALQDITEALLQMGQMEASYKEALTLVIDGDTSDHNVQTLLTYLHLVEGSVHRPWRDINDSQEAYKQCLNMCANCYPPLQD